MLLPALVLGVVILVIDIILMVTDPVLIIAKYSVRVDYGSLVYEALSEENAGVHVATYLFNVTNAERFQAGLDHNLKVEEVGPFTYQEFRVNDQLELDLNASVIRYSPRIRPQFLPNQSVAYPEDLNVTMPNLAMLSMASKVGSYGFLPRMGFNILASRLKSRPIVRMRASDYLWGYDEPLIRLGHDLIPGLVNFDILGILDRSMASKVGSYGFLPRMGFNILASRLKSRPIVRMRASDYLWGYDEPLIRLGHDLIPGLVNFDILGILDRLYDKKAKNLFELSTNEEDKFSIRTVNGVKGLEKWGYNNPEKRTICNSFTNTYEGIGYPPEMTGNRTIRIYRSVLCRFLDLDYHGTLMTPYGVEGLEYKISNRTYQRNEETECLCNEGNCIEGVSDLSPCFLGLPLVLSHGHFMHADPKLYSRIEGIKPDEKRHGSSFVIEPKIGMVLNTQFTVQVNLLVRDVRFNSESSRFSDMLIPVVYFNIMQPPLKPKYQHNLNLIYFIGPKLLLAIKILLAASTLGLLAYATKLFYCNKLPVAKHIVLVSDVTEPFMK